MTQCFKILFLSWLGFVPILTWGQQLAFPGAEGYGRYTTGGRGGVVYEVTNLTDDGAGSLRYGIESLSGPRTIVFKVSGIIELTKTLSIKNGDLTLAGQTAPGEGICLKNKKLIVPVGAVTAVTEIPGYSFVIDADDVIIRYLRFRPGDEIDNTVGAPLSNIKFENDGIWGRNHKNIIIDHCSMSWAIDEVASFYDNENFTLQWSIIGESLYSSFHSKGNHGYGGIWGGWGASFHHNLIANHTSRNPRFCGARYHVSTASREVVDFRNNVVFNWAGNNVYGGEGGQQNIVGNYYKPGPATIKKGGTQLYRLVNPSVSLDPKVDSISKWFIIGNMMNGYPSISNNNAVLGQGFQPQYADSVAGLWTRVSDPFPFASITSQTALAAYDSVLNRCGASLFRDTIDKRIVYQARTGTATTGGTFGSNTGIIDTPLQVGGWPALSASTAPSDIDHDGMPDAWETANGIDPNNANDRNNIGSDGYTALEKYLNSRANIASKSLVELSSMVVGNGSVFPANGSFEEGTSMTIKAAPSAGWQFSGWSGDTSALNSLLVVKMDKNRLFTATFSMLPASARETLNLEGSAILCSPNPIKDKALIIIKLTHSAKVLVVLHDSSGKFLRTILSGNIDAGEKEFLFDTSGLTSGIYILSLSMGQNNDIQSKILVKH